MRRKPRFYSTSSTSCVISARRSIPSARANMRGLRAATDAISKARNTLLLSRRENLTLDGKKALKTLLAANKRLNTAYLLKESFGQIWDYEREAWARRFFENWR